jgi:hypothetical protein
MYLGNRSLPGISKMFNYNQEHTGYCANRFLLYKKLFWPYTDQILTLTAQPRSTRSYTDLPQPDEPDSAGYVVAPSRWVQGVFVNRHLEANPEKNTPACLGISLMLALSSYGAYHTLLAALYKSWILFNHFHLETCGISQAEFMHRPPRLIHFPAAYVKFPQWPDYLEGFQDEWPIEIQALLTDIGITLVSQRAITDKEGRAIFIRLLLTPDQAGATPDPLSLALARYEQDVKEMQYQHQVEFSWGLYQV